MAGRSLGPPARRSHLAVAQETQCFAPAVRREPVDVEVAVDVVHLVLEAPGHEAAPFYFDRSAFYVHARDRGPGRTGQGHKNVGDREAALIAQLLAFREDQLRVHHVTLVAVNSETKDSEPDPDLRCGQPGPARLPARFRHVVDQRAQGVVEAGHRGARAPQHRVTK